MQQSETPILVTGAAGFVGSAVAKALLYDGREVVGLDNLNAYYDPALKTARLDRLREHDGFSFRKLDLADESGMQALFGAHEFRQVVHLAAQAGVRYSIESPGQYISSNVAGLTVLLECCVRNGVQHLLYASSSSVYGDTEKTPFSEQDTADRPRSVYAATKRALPNTSHSRRSTQRVAAPDIWPRAASTAARRRTSAGV